MLPDDANILVMVIVYTVVGFSFRCGWMIAGWMITGEWK